MTIKTVNEDRNVFHAFKNEEALKIKWVSILGSARSHAFIRAREGNVLKETVILTNKVRLWSVSLGRENIFFISWLWRSCKKEKHLLSGRKSRAVLGLHLRTLLHVTVTIKSTAVALGTRAFPWEQLPRPVHVGMCLGPNPPAHPWDVGWEVESPRHPDLLPCRFFP